MSLVSRVNLIGVISPVCLLECKKAIKELKSGEQVIFLLDDTVVANDLITIIERSKDRIVDVDKKADHCQIAIQKG